MRLCRSRTRFPFVYKTEKPPWRTETARGKASGYHRDRWGRMPNGNYERPLAFNAITYLQDLTDDNGPVRRLCSLPTRVCLSTSACVPLPLPAPAPAPAPLPVPVPVPLPLSGLLSLLVLRSSVSSLAATSAQSSSTPRRAPNRTVTKRSFT